MNKLILKSYLRNRSIQIFGSPDKYVSKLSNCILISERVVDHNGYIRLYLSRDCIYRANVINGHTFLIFRIIV